jgi:hypothetical protein
LRVLDSSHASPMDAKTNMRLLSLFCTSCPIDVIAPANLGGSTVEVFASNWSSNNAQVCMSYVIGWEYDYLVYDWLISTYMMS